MSHPNQKRRWQDKPQRRLQKRKEMTVEPKRKSGIAESESRKRRFP
jgi:hypothetical protein